jgi:hypothetical protein
VRLAARLRAVDLHEHRVIDVRAERIFNGRQIGLVAVRRGLHAVAQAAHYILHELVRRTAIARADEPRRDQLRVGIPCDRPGWVRRVRRSNVNTDSDRW